ncbi:MAG: NAD(P)H-binding protein [Solirubrobacteraceae bacterium]
MDRSPNPILLTGASGYVGSHLLTALADAGHDFRVLTRSPDGHSFPEGTDVRGGDALSGDGLDGALEGVKTAFYLIHSMGGADGDFDAADRRAATNFARAAKEAGVERVVYLGGLDGASAHLQSRAQTARALQEHGPQLVHARAAMVIGTGSASFEIVRHLVNHLPVMIAPLWVETRTQPIAIDDTVRALIALAEADDPPGEVQLGGADVLTYREMMERYAALAGRRKRVLFKVPLFTPRLSSYWVALVTPVSLGLIQPLVEGLGAEMLVTEPPPPGINEAPIGFDDAVRAAMKTS